MDLAKLVFPPWLFDLDPLDIPHSRPQPEHPVAVSHATVLLPNFLLLVVVKSSVPVWVS